MILEGRRVTVEEDELIVFGLLRDAVVVGCSPTLTPFRPRNQEFLQKNIASHARRDRVYVHAPGCRLGRGLRLTPA